MTLGLVAVQRVRRDPLALEEGDELVRPVLRAREDQRLAGGLGLENRAERTALLQLVDRHDDVLDALGGLGSAADFDRGVTVQGAPRQRVHFGRDRRREEHRLALLRQRVQDAPHVGRKSHVQHAVGFVEDQHLELREIDVAPLHVIEQAARRGDDHVDAMFQRAGLRLHPDAAVDGRALQMGVPPVGADTRGDLLGELARGHENQGPQSAALAWRQPLQDGQHERGRLAGAGLGRSDEIAAREGQGNRFRLDGGWVRVAFIGDRANQFGR